MRRRSLAVLALTFPVILFAADLFGSLGWDQSAFEDKCFQFVSQPDRLPSFRPTPAMRALAVAQRKGAVASIGAKAKAYYASEVFRQRWAEYRSSATGGAERERQNADLAKQQAEMMNQSIQQMEQMLPMMPPASQGQIKEAIQKAKAEQAKLLSGEQEGVPTQDPKIPLRKALQHYLAVTDGIDYAAAISNYEGRRTFTNPVFESKPAEWKMAFRAGREASEEARNYVKAWIAELK